jgi:hypothetical protein
MMLVRRYQNVAIMETNVVCMPHPIFMYVKGVNR